MAVRFLNSWRSLVQSRPTVESATAWKEQNKFEVSKESVKPAVTAIMAVTAGIRTNDRNRKSSFDGGFHPATTVNETAAGGVFPAAAVNFFSYSASLCTAAYQLWTRFAANAESMTGNTARAAMSSVLDIAALPLSQFFDYL